MLPFRILWVVGLALRFQNLGNIFPKRNGDLLGIRQYKWINFQFRLFTLVALKQSPKSSCDQKPIRPMANPSFHRRCAIKPRIAGEFRRSAGAMNDG
jgi:hypothetical protein